MADRKISAFTSATSVANTDVVPVVTDMAGTPQNKKITVAALFGSVPANTIINATFTANTDVIRVTTAKTPANSTITIKQGSMFWDTSYLYCAVANNVVKRIAWTSF